EQHVAAPAQALDLTGKHLLIAVVIGDRRQRRSVGRERDRRVSRPVQLVAAGDFGGDVLCVAGAAAVADEQELVAGAKRRNRDVGDCPRGREHRGIPRRALERSERLLEMNADEVFRILAHDHDSFGDGSWNALVMTQLRRRKRAIINARSGRRPDRANAVQSPPHRTTECRACSGDRSWCRRSAGRAGRPAAFWSAPSPQARSKVPTDGDWWARKYR